MTQETRVEVLDLNNDQDIPMQLDDPWSDTDNSDNDNDDHEARNAHLCALPPGDEAAAESGEGGETDLLMGLEHVVRPFVKCPYPFGSCF